MTKIYLRQYFSARFLTKVILSLTVIAVMIFLYFYLTGTGRARLKDWLDVADTPVSINEGAAAKASINAKRVNSPAAQIDENQWIVWARRSARDALTCYS